MELKWSYTYDQDPATIWPPDYHGVFVPGAQNVRFFFKKHRHLAFLEANTQGITEIRSFQPSHKITIPSRWVLEESNLDVLVCSEECALRLDTMEELADVPPDALNRFMNREAEQIARHITNDSHFGEYVITHVGQCSYACLRNGREQWKLRGQGYLYTEIQSYGGDRIFFGTDGNGGRFYLIDLKTGNVITEINTGGTNQILGFGETRFVLQLGKNSEILEVSLKDGQVKSSVCLPGFANTESRMYLSNQGIYVTTFQMKARNPVAAIISYVSLL